ARESSYVLFMDMDDFKRVNDSMGHSVGDEALISIAERLLICTRSSDTVARMGGDEFAILMESCSLTDATRLAVRIIEAMRQPLSLSTGHLQLSPSIGIAAASGEQEPKEVLRNADVAMYLAKREAQSHYQVFEQEMYTEVVRRIETETQLRTALDEDQLEIYLQPIVELASGRPVGAEVLMRWNHPDRGLIMPSDFIAIAEETGLIIDMGRWVMNQACELLASWASDPVLREMTLTVNISGRQLRDPKLLPDIGSILLRTGADASRLAIELTESVMAQNVEQTAIKLRGIQALGANLAIDDFGTGYSSLGYLQNFPLNILKIDRSFVRQLTSSEDSSLVKVIIGIGESLGLATVAEGIETEEQRRLVMALGCEMGQGYLFAKPAPVSDFRSFVASSFLTRIHPPIRAV
ncbi:MAG: putative bifunctional diguanylate cyclase/phosphodiesterase, partial [Actinomycetota bacterium]